MEINRVIRNLNGAIITIEIDGVEYRPVEKPEPEPRTGQGLDVNGKWVLAAMGKFRFRKDPRNPRVPDIVNADGEPIGYVSIVSGEVSVE